MSILDDPRLRSQVPTNDISNTRLFIPMAKSRYKLSYTRNRFGQFIHAKVPLRVFATLMFLCPLASFLVVAFVLAVTQ